MQQLRELHSRRVARRIAKGEDPNTVLQEWDLEKFYRLKD